MIPLPLLLMGKVAFAGGVSLVGHKLAMRTQKATDYANMTPAFAPIQHLGNMRISGLVHGPLGKVIYRFSGTQTCQWNGNHGHVNKSLLLDDGERFEQLASLYIRDGKVQGHADNAQGPLKGTISGNALHLTYKLKLPKHASGLVVNVDDWFYALDNGTVINRSQIHKLGYPLGDITSTLIPT